MTRTRAELQLTKLACQIQLGEINLDKVVIQMTLPELSELLDLCTKSRAKRKKIKEQLSDMTKTTENPL